VDLCEPLHEMQETVEPVRTDGENRSRISGLTPRCTAKFGIQMFIAKYIVMGFGNELGIQTAGLENGYCIWEIGNA
jgi:hypothetical protein